jgi:hypothetical protein
MDMAWLGSRIRCLEEFLPPATRMTHPATLPAADLLRDCSETRTRRSGPGGQHRNKVETAVVLLHRPTGISGQASERRSQAENRRQAIWRLRLALALEHRPESQAEGRSAVWESRLRGRRIEVAADHDDYPALVAEACDRLQAAGWEVGPAAEVLGVSQTQLVGLFRKTPQAWESFTSRRAALGLHRLA